jgi:hypothetical protein
MGLGVSLILIAAGAILAWAVNVSPSGVDVNTIGVILMIVGIVGGLLSMVFWSTWWGPGYFRRGYGVRRRVVGRPGYVAQAPPAAYPPQAAPPAAPAAGQYEEEVVEEEY